MKQLVKLIVTAAVLATTATAAMADGAKIAVVGGKSDDPFFAKIKKGIDDAAMIVKAHGGSLRFANRRGRGCVFSFTLPADPYQQTRDQLPQINATSRIGIYQKD